MTKRHPFYAEADIVVDSTAQPADLTTEQVIEALRDLCWPTGGSDGMSALADGRPSGSTSPAAATISPSGLA